MSCGFSLKWKSLVPPKPPVVPLRDRARGFSAPPASISPASKRVRLA